MSCPPHPGLEGAKVARETCELYRVHPEEKSGSSELIASRLSCAGIGRAYKARKLARDRGYCWERAVPPWEEGEVPVWSLYTQFGAGTPRARRGTRSSRKQSREVAVKAGRGKPKTPALRVPGLEPGVNCGPGFPERPPRARHRRVGH